MCSFLLIEAFGDVLCKVYEECAGRVVSLKTVLCRREWNVQVNKLKTSLTSVFEWLPRKEIGR